MMKYKTDLHCHTSEFSGCAHENCVNMIEKYIRHGYTSVAVTNHFEWKRLGAPKEYRYRYDTYDEFVDRLFNCIEYIRRRAMGRINILTGYELCNSKTENDYLIYGLTREMTKDFDMFTSSIESVHDYVHSCGGIMIQAHPMRVNMTLLEPDLVDGYEIYNATPKWRKVNTLAEQWVHIMGAEGKILTAGNDHHDPQDIPSAGILTEHPITTDAELIRVLREQDFEIFHE